MKFAAAGIIIENKKILLVKRAPQRAFSGYWGFVGGHQEGTETAVENVVREVKEETNLDFRPTTIFRQGQYDDLYYHLFLGEHCGKIIPQQEEVAEWKWFTYEEANQLDLIYDSKDILHNLRQEGLL